jgi:hypothetical protein
MGLDLRVIFFIQRGGYPTKLLTLDNAILFVRIVPKKVPLEVRMQIIDTITNLGDFDASLLDGLFDV